MFQPELAARKNAESEKIYIDVQEMKRVQNSSTVELKGILVGAK